MNIRRNSGGSLMTELSFDALPQMKAASIWHPQIIEVLSLKQIKRYRSGVHEVSLSLNEILSIEKIQGDLSPNMLFKSTYD